MDAKAFDGKATLKEVTISFGPPDTPKIHLLLVVPNARKSPAPVFVGMNFHGNHTLVNDPAVRLPTVWMPTRPPASKDNRATDAGRGTQIDVWALEQSIDRGYAVATFYCGDVDPDRPDVREGIQPHLRKTGEEAGPHDWGTIAAWAWGISRAVDYLRTDKDMDKDQIAVVGHSRLGKAAILAGAFDERIALVIPLQAGCGGTAPSRGKVPRRGIGQAHQHQLPALVRRRRSRSSTTRRTSCRSTRTAWPRWWRRGRCCTANAVEDKWANPEGQFEMLQVRRRRVPPAGGRRTGGEGDAGSRQAERRRARLLHPSRQAFDDEGGLEGVPGLRRQALRTIKASRVASAPGDDFSDRNSGR